MRLIDLDYAIYQCYNVSHNYDLADMPEFLSNLPEIDAKPVVHARWINSDEEPYCKNSLCSNCMRGSIFTSDYCMHCGAKMDLQR